MRRLGWVTLAVAGTVALVAAGRAWNPRVEEWTADPPASWRGLDGFSYTLALPNDFSADFEDTRQGEQELTVRPPDSQGAALHIWALTDEAPRLPLRTFLGERLGLRRPGVEQLVRLGGMLGPGEIGTRPSGNAWKAAALDAAAFPGPRSVRTLVVAYDQVPQAQREVFDRIAGSVRLTASGR